MLATTLRPRATAVALAALVTAPVAACTAEEGSDSAGGGGQGRRHHRPDGPVQLDRRRPDQRHPERRSPPTHPDLGVALPGDHAARPGRGLDRRPARGHRPAHRGRAPQPAGARGQGRGEQGGHPCPRDLRRGGRRARCVRAYAVEPGGPLEGLTSVDPAQRLRRSSWTASSTTPTPATSPPSRTASASHGYGHHAGAGRLASESASSPQLEELLPAAKSRSSCTCTTRTPCSRSTTWCSSRSPRPTATGA